MSVTFAPDSWPTPARVARAFGQAIALPGRPGSAQALQWRLAPADAPWQRQAGNVCALLCGLLLALALLLVWKGAALAWVGLDLLVAGLLLGLAARHAGDSETLTLVGRLLLVEQCTGRRVAHTDFAAEWATVEPAAGQGSLVQIRGQGRMVRVGRFLRPEARAVLAQELRRALRRVSVGPVNDSN